MNANDELVLHAIRVEAALRRRAARFVGAADAEDVLQDMYLQLLNLPSAKAAEIRNPVRFAAAVARDAIEKHVTRKSKARNMEEAFKHESAPSFHLSPERAIVAQEELLGVLERTPFKPREFLWLYLVEGLSVQEIAQKTGSSSHAVARGIANARRKAIRANDAERREPLPPTRFNGTLYEITTEIALPETKIITEVAPRVVVASAALAERLKREPQSVYRLSPRQFEELIAELLRDLGYDVELTPATRDGGADLLAYMKTELGTFLCLVEAKKYRSDRKVGLELVRSLYGALNDWKASSAMLITTSSFTRDAKEFQQRYQYQLALRDYSDLVGWIMRYGASRH